MEMHVTLEQMAKLVLINVSYYLHRYNRDTSKYELRFTDSVEYSKARFALGFDSVCH